MLARRYRRPAVPPSTLVRLIEESNAISKDGAKISSAASELCFYIEGDVGENDAVLSWLLSETYEPADFASVSFLDEVRRVSRKHLTSGAEYCSHHPRPYSLCPPRPRLALRAVAPWLRRC